MSVIPLLLCLSVGVNAPGDASSAPTLSDLAALDCRFQPGDDVTVALAMSAHAQEAEPRAEEDDVATSLDTDYTRTPRYGREGSRRWRLHGAYGGSVQDHDDTFGLVGVGFSHFIADGVSLDLELNGMFFHQEIEDASGLNASLLFRWHFIRKRDWSMYLDGGAGVLWSTNDVPAQGSSFNFTPQAGLGFTFDVGDDVRLVLGGRWHHISNANLYSDNPGRDSFMGYVGVSFPF
ncbi:MAG: acyloxyacyl hydrolase [Planctomycetota bacterium]|nr:acyloxyacyl hydrolase [Planctomycetota bacterium]